MDYLFTGKVIPVYNEEILDEYLNVLSRPKFKLSREVILALIEGIKEIGISVERVKCNIDMPDPKDVVFYEIALSKEFSYLVTGNIKHFPSTSIVVTPAEMIHIIEFKG